jgi:hypothetical protein
MKPQGITLGVLIGVIMWSCLIWAGYSVLS